MNNILLESIKLVEIYLRDYMMLESAKLPGCRAHVGTKLTS